MTRWRVQRFAAELFRPSRPELSPALRTLADRLLHARHRAAYEWALPYVAGRRTLEIGVDHRYGSRLLAREASCFVAVDLDFTVASEARRETKTVLQADGQSLPLRDDSVDVVVTFQVIEQVWNDRRYLAEIRRVLRPGGLLLVSTPQRRSHLLPGQRPWASEHLRAYDERQWATRVAQIFGDVTVSGLFGDDDATRLERARTPRDAWGHFFGGPWGPPVRVAGRAASRLLGSRLAQTADREAPVADGDLGKRFYFDSTNLHRALDLFAVCEKTGAPATSAVTFNGADYWRERLSGAPSLIGTGTNAIPIQWQRSLYRGKVRAYRRLLDRSGITVRGKHVVDFGCGSGYFEDIWERHGARRADGIDIVPSMIAALQQRYPHRRYVCGDLAAGTADVAKLGQPNLVTAIDVFYHIVDDDALVRTLRGLAGLLASDGALLFTDALEERETASHVRFRSLNQWRQILHQTGLALLDVEPVFALNNRQVRGVRRFPGTVGVLQHFADLPVLRTMPWLANNWAVVARRAGA
jgi:SAM-dependent methyltransferase